MKMRRSLRLHTLRASEVLPFYDSVFAVAFTLLAYNLPDRLMAMAAGAKLLHSMSVYALAGVAVFLYWFRLRRLIEVDRYLQPLQLGLVALALMVVVVLPKLASLVLSHGAGSGSIVNWSQAQVVNTLCLSFLVLINLICLLYARSLQNQRVHRSGHSRFLNGVIRTQTIGLYLNLALIVLELSFTWFDTQYLYLLPLTLIAEEIVIARWIRRSEAR